MGSCELAWNSDSGHLKTVELGGITDGYFDRGQVVHDNDWRVLWFPRSIRSVRPESAALSVHKHNRRSAPHQIVNLGILRFQDVEEPVIHALQMLTEK